MNEPTKKHSLTIYNSDYIVSDHRVYDVRIMPGVTFFDILYRLLQKELGPNGGDFAIHHALFKQPVVTSPDFDYHVEIALNRFGTGFKAYARGKKRCDGKLCGGKWSDLADFEIHRADPLPNIRKDISRLKQQAARRYDMDRVYSRIRNVGIDHLTFMKALGDVYWSNDFLLADMELSRPAQDHAEFFHLHPSH